MIPVQERNRPGLGIAVVLLLVGCSPTPPEVMDTSGESTSAPSGGSTEAPGTSSTGDPATTALDGVGTTSEPAPSSSSEGSGSSSAVGSSTGEPGDCHPLLVEVYYDTQNSEDDEQWTKLYNPCTVVIDLGGYSLGWSGNDYTFGTLDLQGSIGIGECFIVGGPLSTGDNAFPMLDQPMDFDPDIQKGGGVAEGLALFVGAAASIATDTMPVDAVIYGEENTSGLLDAEGNMPDPHVGNAGDQRSLRRTGEGPTWIIEAEPMPALCPPY